MLPKTLKNPVLSTAAFGLIGAAAGLAAMAAAQTVDTQTAAQASTTTAPTTQSASVGTAEAPHAHGHAPLGGDGNITAINGSTITMQEESDEGGATYTVNASSATVTKDGTTATLADLKVGDKIFVQGTTQGTTVTATTIHSGHGGFGHGPTQGQ
jgi:hypothetical protein